MKRTVLLIFILSIYIIAYGDAKSQCETLFDKAEKELDMRNYAKALEYFIEAKTIAKNNNLVKQQINALTRIGITYWNISDYENAIKSCLEGYQLAIKEPRKYKEEEINLLNNISNFYSLNKDYANAREYVGKAYQNAIQTQDSLRTGIFAAHLAQIANQTGDLEQAEKYLDIAMLMLKNQTKHPSWLLAAKSVRMENLYLKKEYRKAEQLALEILQSLTEQNLTTLDNSLKTDCLLCLSRIYQQKKEFQKAIDAAKQALDNCSDLRISLVLYEHLLRVYLDKDASPFSVQYLDSLLITKDSLAKIANLAQVMNNQVRFELINSEKALAERKAKQKAERTLFIFIILFITFSVLILVLVTRMRVAKNKQLKIAAELKLEKEMNEKLLIIQQTKKQEIVFLMEQKRLNEEIYLKNKQLASKILFQSSRNELIKEIINMLAKIPNLAEIPMLQSIIGKLKSQSRKATNWSSFLTYFEQINPKFLSALREKHPDLTADETRFLSYIYLNFDIKEISKLFNVTPEYCRKKKYRISKKLNISTAEMYQYLIKIDKDCGA